MSEMCGLNDDDAELVRRELDRDRRPGPTAMSDDLATFLLARIAEDEQVAQGAIARASAWAPNLPPWETTRYLGKFGTGLDRHIAHWNPARVLAECEAKRRIIAEHALYPDSFDMECRCCGTPLEYGVSWPCQTLRLLAAPYAAHDEFKPYWAPDSSS